MRLGHRLLRHSVELVPASPLTLLGLTQVQAPDHITASQSRAYPTYLYPGRVSQRALLTGQTSLERLKLQVGVQ